MFSIRIHFDNKGRVDKIENKWDVKLPEWYGYDINEIEINNWIRRKEPDCILKNVNENTSKIAFDDEIKYELKKDVIKECSKIAKNNLNNPLSFRPVSMDIVIVKEDSLYNFDTGKKIDSVITVITCV